MLLHSRLCRCTAVVATCALHAGAAIWLLRMQPMQAQIPARKTEPILVQWIARQPMPPLAPQPVQPAIARESKPAQRLPVQDVLRRDTPSTQETTAPTAEPRAPPESAAPTSTAESAPAPTVVESASGQPSLAAREPQISPPSFNAAYLQNPSPRYPQTARRNGESGRVILRVLVTARGTAERVELRTSSGSPRLDGAALETVQRWKFVPARQGETPVAAWVLVPILFALEG